MNNSSPNASNDVPKNTVTIIPYPEIAVLRYSDSKVNVFDQVYEALDELWLHQYGPDSWQYKLSKHNEFLNTIPNVKRAQMVTASAEIIDLLVENYTFKSNDLKHLLAIPTDLKHYIILAEPENLFAAEIYQSLEWVQEDMKLAKPYLHPLVIHTYHSGKDLMNLLKRR